MWYAVWQHNIYHTAIQPASHSEKRSVVIVFIRFLVVSLKTTSLHSYVAAYGAFLSLGLSSAHAAALETFDRRFVSLFQSRALSALDGKMSIVH
jgi:hypothetical protein